MGVISRIRPHVLNRFGAETVEIPSWLRSSLVGYWSGGHRDNVYYGLTNIVTGGNFPSTTGWSGNSATISAANNTMSVTATGATAFGSFSQTTNVDCVTGKKIYVTTKQKVSDAVCVTLRVSVEGTAGIIYAKTINTPTQNQQYSLSGIVTLTGSFTGKVRIYIYAFYADAATANGKVMEVQNVMAYDLGDSNSPLYDLTATELDAILLADGTPYWDGTRNVKCNPNQQYFWADYSGNGRHSKANNMAWSTSSGWDGYLLVHDGTDDYLRRTLSAAIADGSSYSYSLTVKSVANKAIANLHTTTTVAMIIGLDANGYAYVTVYDTAANAYTVTDNTSKAGILTRITAVVDIAAMKLYLYVNGVSKGTPATLANTIRGFITASVGTNAATNAYTALSVGMGMQVSRALTAAEEAQLYNANKRRFNI